MDSAAFYRRLYGTLENCTPLGFDCGRLCGAACCSSDLPGMYLFPGEDTLFKGKPGFTISGAELPGYGRVPLLSCTGACDRKLRPLSCRIFPLAPKVSGDAGKVRPDPRGKSLCPLCSQPVSSLSPGFVKASEAVFAELLAEPETAMFLRALCAHVDEYAKPLL